MNSRIALPASFLVLALAAAGCGGGDNSNGGGGGGQAKTTEQKPAGGGGGGGKTAQMSMKNIQFNPRSITVSSGGTVKWTNDDSVNHDVTKTGGPGPDFSSGTGNMAQGDTYKHTFDQPGKYELVCTVHPNMTATVTVK
jgi:plastocyanin